MTRSFLAFFFIVFAGCVQSVPAPPPPDRETKMASPLPSSVVDLPVEIDLALVRDLLEREVPQVLEHEKTWERSGNTGVRYRIERGPIEVAFDGGELQVHAQLRYRAQVCAGFANVCQPIASCGYGKDGMRRVDVTLRSPLEIGADWQLRTKIRASHHFVDPCEVTFLRVDVSGPLDDLLRDKIAPLLPKLERKLASAADVRGRAARAWARMQEPLRLYDGVWLVLAPEAVRVSAPVGDGDKVRFVVGITGTPRVVAGERPAVEARALPELQRGDGSEGFSLYVQAFVPYDEASRHLQTAMVGRSFEAGGQRVVVLDAEVSGTSGGAAVRLEVESDRGLFRRSRGTVYVVGRPVYDPVAGVLSLEGLDYSLESRDLPLRMAESLLRPELLSLLQKKAQFKVGRRIEQVRALAAQALDRELTPGVRLSGALDRVEPIEVVAERDRFVASVAGFGSAQVAVGAEVAARAPRRQHPAPKAAARP